MVSLFTQDHVASLNPYTFCWWTGLIHGSNYSYAISLAGSYVILFFTASNFTLTTDISSAEHHFHFGPATSFFLELLVTALFSSPVAYQTPSNLRSSSSSVLSFCLFILFMGFSWQEYWSGLPFPPPVDHICQNSSLWPIRLGWPAGLGSQLHWVRQAPLLQQGCDPWRGSPHMLGYFYCMTNIYEKLFQT